MEVGKLYEDEIPGLSSSTLILRLFEIDEDNDEEDFEEVELIKKELKGRPRENAVALRFFVRDEENKIQCHKNNIEKFNKIKKLINGDFPSV